MTGDSDSNPSIHRRKHQTIRSRPHPPVHDHLLLTAVFARVEHEKQIPVGNSGLSGSLTIAIKWVRHLRSYIHNARTFKEPLRAIFSFCFYEQTLWPPPRAPNPTPTRPEVEAVPAEPEFGRENFLE